MRKVHYDWRSCIGLLLALVLLITTVMPVFAEELTTDELATVAETEVDTVESAAEDSSPLLLTDEETGVFVEVPADAIPEGMTRDQLLLRVKNLTEREQRAYLNTVGVSEDELLWVYDISLLNKETGNEVEPNGLVSVIVPEQTPEGANIVHVSDEGEANVLTNSAVATEEMAMFESDSFSPIGAVLTSWNWSVPVTTPIYAALPPTMYERYGFPTIIYYQEDGVRLGTGFCIEPGTIFQSGSMDSDGNAEAPGYTITYVSSVNDVNSASSETLTEEEFKLFKRILYTYYTQFRDAKYFNEDGTKNVNADAGITNGSYSGAIWYKNGTVDGKWYQLPYARYEEYYWGNAQYKGHYMLDEYVQAKHWMYAQGLIHILLIGQVRDTQQNSPGNFANNYLTLAEYLQRHGGATGQAYYDMLYGSNDVTDEEIDAYLDFKVGTSPDSQNVVIVVPSTGGISTTVNVNGNSSTESSMYTLTNPTVNEDGTVTVQVTDTVQWSNFKGDEVLGKTYTVRAVLYEKHDNGVLSQVAETNRLTNGSTTVTVNAESGSFTMDFGTLQLEPGKEYVVYEEMLLNGERKFAHQDANDNAQSFKIQDIDYVNFKVKKTWEDGLTPEAVTVELYKNGVATGKTVELSASNNWTYEWTKLLPGTYTAKELGYAGKGFHPELETETGSGAMQQVQNQSTTVWNSISSSQIQHGDRIVLYDGTGAVSYSDRSGYSLTAYRRSIDTNNIEATPSAIWTVQSAGSGKVYLYNETSGRYLSVNENTGGPWSLDTATSTSANTEFTIDSQKRLSYKNETYGVGYNPNGSGNYYSYNRTAYTPISFTIYRAETTVTTEEAYVIHNVADVKHNLQIYKTDGSTGLAGATFSLYTSDGQKIGTVTTGDSGVVTFTNLESGGYYLVEDAAPEGYYQITDRIYLYIAVDGSVTQTSNLSQVGIESINNGTAQQVRILNTLKPTTGDLELVKVDAENSNQKLEGATFELSKDGKTVTMKTSDEGGVIRFEDLPFGTYTLTETIAPDNYTLESTPIVVELSEEGVRVVSAGTNVTMTVVGDQAVLEVTNKEKVVAVLPSAGGNGMSQVLKASLSILSLSCVAFYLRKRWIPGT